MRKRITCLNHTLRRLCCIATLIGLLQATLVAAQPLFTDITDAVGLDAYHGPTPFSVVFVDYNNDGFQDVFFAGSPNLQRTWVGLFQNTGDGRLIDMTSAIPSELHSDGDPVFGILADYDNDGDEDLYLAVLNPNRNLLLRNDRGLFTQVTFDAEAAPLFSGEAIWLDYDRDGHLDLYSSRFFGNPQRGNRLFRNNGAGLFVDRTEASGLDSLFHPQGGGSVGGMAGGDFNNDGWPDLYIGNSAFPLLGDATNLPNRLFLSDGQGGFVDATTSGIADEGNAFGLAVGDIDNDGDLDIFQTTIADQTDEDESRNLMLSNLSDGQFLDVTEGVGLGVSVLGWSSVGSVFADVDNDGDLDLVIGLSRTRSGEENFLLLNDGSGIFTDATNQSGIDEVGGDLAFGDFDEDGFVDLFYPSLTRARASFYRNNGNNNHWLRVELIGIESNRNGIGARLFADAGDLRQMREILGGLGRQQDEKVAHFGLARHTQVDRLEIRWPSGQVDVLENIPADRKIRVFEGREGYQVVEPTRWEHSLPAVVLEGETVTLAASVRPALFEPDAEVLSVTLDLSAFGGSAEQPLTRSADGSYTVEASFTVGPSMDVATISVLIEQSTSLGPHWVRLDAATKVAPAPVPGQTFTDVAALAGVHGTRGSAIWGDYDGDGDQDLFLPNRKFATRFYRNNGAGSFTDVADLVGVDSRLIADGAAFSDYDNDGDLDLFVASWPIPHATYQLYQNDGDGTFVEVAATAGVDDGRLATGPSTGPSWSDYDLDGDVDLYVPIWSNDPNIFFENQADGTFIDVAAARGIDGGKSSFSFWADYDNDGDPDLFLGNGRDTPARLYRNEREGEAFTDVTEASGVGAFFGNFGFVSPAWGDYDNDGFLDLGLTQAAREGAPRENNSWLFRNNRDGTFQDVTETAGIEQKGDGHGIDWGDYDGDGLLDLLLTSSEDGNRLYRNQADGTFADVAVSTGVDGRHCAGAVWVDFDTDGDLDIHLDQTYTHEDQTFGPRLYRNDGKSRRWLQVQASGRQSNRSGIGAVATAVTGSHRQRRDLASQGGKTMPMEFGLGDATIVDSLIVAWPSGQVDVITDLAVDQIIRVTEGQGHVTAVEEVAGAGPQAFALHQNYPNPFNSGTVIRFAVPTSGEVELAVYNLAGQKVVNLVQGLREAGQHVLRWDGRDGAGRELASGVYFYRLRAGDRVETRKLLLLQ